MTKKIGVWCLSLFIIYFRFIFFCMAYKNVLLSRHNKLLLKPFYNSHLFTLVVIFRLGLTYNLCFFFPSLRYTIHLFNLYFCTWGMLLNVLQVAPVPSLFELYQYNYFYRLQLLFYKPQAYC